MSKMHNEMLTVPGDCGRLTLELYALSDEIAVEKTGRSRTVSSAARVRGTPDDGTVKNQKEQK